MPLLYGLHDREAAPHVPAGGWCVDTIALSENPAPTDYAALRGDINWIVRVNWGYGSTGTIPAPGQDQLFWERIAHYVHNSRGVHAWIIGNEPNHEQERPNGLYITPLRYAEFFTKIRTLIKTVDLNARVIPAPCAPYHANPTNWLDYWRDMLGYIAKNGGCDGIAVHAYTRSSKPEDITSTATMGYPLDGQYSGFWTYVNALDALPSSMQGLPAYITEFNELLEGGWDDRNTGVVQAAYADIDDWNGNEADNEGVLIQCLILYRWPKHDKWYIEGKRGVIDDFYAAVGRGYTSPVKGNDMTETLYMPQVSPGTVAVPDSLPPRQWDERLTQRGVTVETPQVAPGQQFWRVTEARWYDKQESGGRHHIYIEAPSNTPFHALGEGSETKGVTNGKTGFDAANAPMWASEGKNGYSVWVTDGKPTESLEGVGMGADTPGGFNAGIHTSTGVVFELVTMPATTQHPPPAVTPVTTYYVSAPAGVIVREGPGTHRKEVSTLPFGAQVKVQYIEPFDFGGTQRWARIDEKQWVAAWLLSETPPVVAPTEPTPSAPSNEEEAFQRCLTFILRWEGLWADDPNDPGGATMMGITIGTYTRWRQNKGQPVPSKDDLRKITNGEVLDIYRSWYWNASKANTLAWPLCLAQMNIAVNAGPERAKQFLAESGGNFLRYNAIALEWYTRIDGWKHFGAAWTRRCADLLREASK